MWTGLKAVMMTPLEVWLATLGMMTTPLAMLKLLLMMKVGNSLISSAEVEGQVGGQFQQ